MRVVLAGLWARRGLATATLLLGVLALAFAMIGPMYALAAGEHLLDSRIAEMDPTQTLLTADRPAMPESDLPDSPTGWRAPDGASLTSAAADSMRTPGVDRYWQAPHQWLLDPAPTMTTHGVEATMPLYWHEDQCRLAQVTGRCPVGADEALIDPTLAATLGVRVGDRLRLGSALQWLSGGQVHRRAVRRTFTIVGTYRVKQPVSAAWGDPYRLQGDPTLQPPPLGSDKPGPKAPALLVAPAAMTSQTFQGGADRVLRLAAVDLATMTDAATVGTNAALAYARASGTGASPTFDLSSAVETTQREHAALQRITLAAVAPLVVLGLLLLYGLVAASADARRPQVALAKLRGHSRWRVLSFAVLEPAVVIVVAVPLGIVATWLVVHLLARSWLGAETPVRFDSTAWLAGTAVVVAALVAAVAATARVLREPLSQSLGATGQGEQSSRWTLVGRSAVLALAVAACAQVAVSSTTQGGFLHLVAPVLIALATAILAGWLLRRLAGLWITRSARRADTSAYLAARRLGRRRDLGGLVVPLVLATSVAAFATSAWYVGDDWKASRAAAEIGAARTYLAQSSPEHLLAVTHRIDPDGRYLAAALIESSGDGTARQVLLDTSRLATVAAWDPSWSDASPAELQRRLSPRGTVAPITFTGTRIALDIADAHLARSALGEASQLEVDYLDAEGAQQVAGLGRIHDGTLSGRLFHCTSRCVLQRVSVTSGGGAATTTQGAFTITSVSIDGRRADWHLDRPADWRAARPFPATASDPPVAVKAAGGGLKVSVYLDHLPPGSSGQAPATASGIAAITPDDVPDVLPALVADDTPTDRMPPPGSAIGLSYDDDVIAGNALTQTPTPLRPVAHVRALPGLGREGVLVDLAAALRQPPPPRATLDVRLWVAAGTPHRMLEKVEQAGVALSGEQREASVLASLRTDAFGLGWRIFLLVAVLTLLLALVGVYAGTVAQRRWRAFETASLLTVLVRRRTLARAALLEHATVVVLVCVCGLASAWLSLRLVLPTIDLGDTSATDPRADYAIRWLAVGAIGVVVVVLGTLVASLVSVRTVRRTSASALPWEEQQG